MPHCAKNCITIFLTDVCNLNCKYCYCDNDKDKHQSINVDFAKKGIDDFYQEHGYIFMRFFANGEPTVEMDKIRELTEYSREKTDQVTIELQSNGYFSHEKYQWISENVNIVWISYDGIPEVNDIYRPNKKGMGSSDIIIRNIRSLAKQVDQLGVRVTVGHENINRQKEIIDHLASLNVKYIYSDLMFAPIGEDGFEKNIDPMEYAREYVNARRYAEEQDIFYGSYFIINFDGPINISCRACNPSPHLTIDGYVSCCDMAYQGNMFKELIYGEYALEEDVIYYDQKQIEYIRSRTVDNMPECNACDIKYYCAGGCVGESLNERGDIFKIKNENCEAIRYIAQEIGVGQPIEVLHP